MAPDGATGPAQGPLATQLEPALVRPAREDQPHGSRCDRRRELRTPARRASPVCPLCSGAIPVLWQHSGGIPVLCQSFLALDTLV